MEFENPYFNNVQSGKMKTYKVLPSDSLRSIAVSFDTTTSNLMKLNKLSTSTIFPGQKLYVPSEVEPNSNTDTSTTQQPPLLSLPESANRFAQELSFLAPLSPSNDGPRAFQDLVVVSSSAKKTRENSSSDRNDNITNILTEQPKRTEEEVKRSRFRSGESTESEPFEEGFLKLRVKYITIEKDEIGGVMLVTPTAVMFDPNQDDPIVQKMGCSKFGIMCKMTHIVSIAMYHDTEKMKTPQDSLSPTTSTSNVNLCDQPECNAEHEIAESPPDPNIDVNLFQTQEDDFSKLKEEFPFIHSLVSSVEEMLPITEGEDKKETINKKPMYICIRANQPMQHTFRSLDGVESPHKSDTSLEYWFKISNSKSDQVYAFFLQWSPNVVGEDMENMGFIVMNPDSPPESSANTHIPKRARSLTESSLNFIDDYFNPRSIEKEWEIRHLLQALAEEHLFNLQLKVLQEIISLEEAQRRTSCVNLLEMANDDSSLMPTMESKSHLLDDDAILYICHNLPPRCIGYSWYCVYSTFVHGISLKTLYRNMIAIDTPVVMVIQDSDQCIFGAVCSCPLRVSDHYYGTGESFLFTLKPHQQVFKWSGANSFFFKGDMDSLSVGGGKGTFGLWVDGDLYHGYSRPCETFGNEKLAYNEDFCIKSVEVWGFKET